MARRRIHARATLLAATILAVVAAGWALARRAPARAPLDGVLAGGCEEVRRDGTCTVGPAGGLTVFVPDPAEARFAADGRRIEPRAHAEVEGGQRWSVEVPPAATTLDVELDAPPRRARIVLAPRVPPPSWLAAARAAKAEGDLEGARKALEAAPARLEPRDEADAASLRARLALMAGDSAGAARALAVSAEAQRRLGRASRAVDDETARAFVLLEMRALPDAAAALDAAERDAVAYPEGRTNVAYHRGELARARGELRHAFEVLASATSLADRIGYDRLVAMAVQLEALVLVDTGRADDALAVLGRRLDASLSPCDRADLANNRGWAALVAVASGSTADPLPALREAERGYLACNNPRRVANARVNLAWAHLLAGDAQEARRDLARAREAHAHLDALVALFADDLEGRVALAEGASERAAATFADVATRARALALPLDEARAEEGLARALLAARKLSDADAAAARAEALIEEAAALVALGEGRGTFRATRDGAARARLAIALAEDDPARALAIARASRRRAIADLERLAADASLPPAAREARATAIADLKRAREELLAEAEHDWELPAEKAARVIEARRQRALRTTTAIEARLRGAIDRAAEPAREPPRAPHEIELVVHPTLDGWAAFAVSADGAVRSARSGPLRSDAPAAELARLLVEPFDAELARAKRVRVLASGAMRRVDVHALPWRGEPLAATHTVVHAVGRAPAPARSAGTTALVVDDPRIDLRAAAREGERAREALARGGRDVRRLAGATATRAAVLAELGRASFFHYAGHATHAGPDGWESVLLLSRGTSLGIADIATLDAAPSVVVLSACDAARDVGADDDEQASLAHAFLAANAATVIAATRPVDDAVTASLMDAFYTELASGIPADEALARAQAALRARSPAADWAAFRALAQ